MPASILDTDLFMRISDKEFKEIRELVYNRFGINLTDQKRGLVVGRLQSLLKNQGLRNFEEYLDYLKRDRSGQSLVELIDRISTNYTYFYRENAHFEYFYKNALPEVVSQLKLQNQKDLRIWSAGCSTGQEPYFLVMLMLEFFGREYSLWDAGILATDISAEALKTAASGIYPDDEVNLLPKALFRKYFHSAASGQWAVVDPVKKEVTYRLFNLMNEHFPFKKPFQIIFCRNVMIYFDTPTRAALVNKFYNSTAPGGYLFIGHSETLGRQDTPYQYLMPAVYKKV